MTKNELLLRLQGVEWDDFEVKEARTELPKNIWDTVCAFANTSGGWIVLGVKQCKQKFEIQGVENVEKIESDFFNVLRGCQKFNHLLAAEAVKYDFDGKCVIAFYVNSSPLKPIYYGSISNVFLRSGSGDRRATDMEITAMYRDQAFGTKSDQTIDGTSADDLNPSSLETYRNHIRYYNPDFPYKDLETKGDFYF